MKKIFLLALFLLSETDPITLEMQKMHYPTALWLCLGFLSLLVLLFIWTLAVEIKGIYKRDGVLYDLFFRAPCDPHTYFLKG